jgi:hypothetical protein
MDWILALTGAVTGIILIGRFKDWAFIGLAAFVGALLTVRGLQILMPFMQGFIGTLLGVVLAGGSIAYHGGFLSGRKPARS